MNDIQLLRPAELVTSPVFSHVAVVPPNATTVYVGGQNAVDAQGALVGGDDIAAQMRQVMANVEAALTAAGASFADVISMSILVVAGHDLRAAYGVAAASLNTGGSPPLVSVAMVAGLAVPGALIELSAIAAVVR